jgi:outer membrane protein
MAHQKTAWKGLILAATLFAGLSWHAQAQTLSESLAATYQTNPNIAAALDQLRATDEQLAQAYQYWWRPQITGTLEYGKEWIDSSTNTTTDSGGNTITDYHQETDIKQAEITSTLYLWRGGQTKAAIDNAIATINAQRALFDGTVQSTLKTAAEAYANVVLQAASLELAHEHETNMAGVRDTVNDLLIARQATTVDLAQAELSVIEAQGTRADTLGHLQAARSAYNASVGTYPAELQQWPPLPAIPDTLQEAIEIARRDNPSIIAAQAEVLANEAAVREDEGILLPTISIVGDYTLELENTTYTHSSNIAEHDRIGTGSILLEVSIPFYTGGYNYSVAREAKRTLSQSRNKLLAAERTAVDDVTEAWQQLNAAEQRIEIAFAQWAVAAEALAGQEKQFAQALITVKDLIQAHTEVGTARQAVEQAHYDAFVQTVALLVAMGHFNALTLELDVALHDPTANLDAVLDLPLGIGLD